MDTNDSITWVTDQKFRDLGFAPTAPEHDLGQRWGRDGHTRVTFAPCGADDFGYLYAFDATTNRYAMLTASITFTDAISAHAAVLSERPTPDGYLALADLVETEPALSVQESRTLWLHCAEAEASARHRYEQLAIDAPNRFTGAHEFIVARGARVAAEDVLASTLTPERCDSGALLTLGYRVAARPDWRGRVIGANVADVAFQATDLSIALSNLGYSVRPTALSHGQAIVPAAQIPELDRLTRVVDAGHAAELQL